MSDTSGSTGTHLAIEKTGLDRLIQLLAAFGYRVVGPVVRERAIVYDDVSAASDLPEGWTDQQEPGRYGLDRRAGTAVFGYAVGPHSWKRFLHPPTLSLWKAHRSTEGFVVDEPSKAPPPFAFLGVRACELAAIAIQDRVFLDGPFADPHYRERRERAFLVAVNCTRAASTCFCTSMNTGPRVTGSFDLALTELMTEDRHLFLVEVGSARGGEIAARLGATPADDDLLKASARALEATAGQISRRLDTKGLPEILAQGYESPHWNGVAERCLTCTNCTMVCPTCFCTAVEDVSDLTGTEAERVRRWDSCFSVEFSYVHGGSVRTSPASRYRQWLTHKLGTWHAQFGSSGCVGCGRCITWCPVGIDITAEAKALRDLHAGREMNRGNHDA